MQQAHALCRLLGSHAADGSTVLTAMRAADSIPYYGQDRGKSGLNAGVMMMDLARIRQSNFSAERDAILDEYSYKLDLIQLGPQDVLNIYGAFHPDHVYEMPCVYNYRHYSGCHPDSG